MSHYFTNDPLLKTSPRIITYAAGGKTIKLKTEAGVFARDRVDFGTHSLLTVLYRQDLAGKRILDIGCGIGVIGICLAAAFPDADVTMTDINVRAVALANDNCQRNNVPNCRATVSDLYADVLGPYDVIVTNPPIRAGKAIVHRIITEGYGLLSGGGELFAVIRKQQGAESLWRAMETVFPETQLLEKKNGYWILRAARK